MYRVRVRVRVWLSLGAAAVAVAVGARVADGVGDRVSSEGHSHC